MEKFLEDLPLQSTQMEETDMYKFDAGVVIPVYNQWEPLLTVLNGFSEQSYEHNKFEIIIVDDGSTDQLKYSSEAYFNQRYPSLSLRVIHCLNSGRAVARNRGMELMEADIIIFSDADRVPESTFVEKHILRQRDGHNVVVGTSLDYFGKAAFLCDTHIDWEIVNKFSRVPLYNKKLETIIDDDRILRHKWSWLGFLVGNASISRKVADQCAGFCDKFVDWGFEHFEYAYRFYKEGNWIFSDPHIRSFHLPHTREEHFYENKILSTIKLISLIHTEIDSDKLRRFFLDTELRYNFSELEG